MADDTKVEDLGCTPNGAHLYRKQNEVGGYIYYSDEIGGGAMVWDTCLVSEGTLLAAMVCEHHRLHQEYHEKRGWKPHIDADLEMENMAATGGSYLSPAILEDLRKRREQELLDRHKCTITGDRGLCWCGKPVIQTRDDV